MRIISSLNFSLVQINVISWNLTDFPVLVFAFVLNWMIKKTVFIDNIDNNIIIVFEMSLLRLKPRVYTMFCVLFRRRFENVLNRAFNDVKYIASKKEIDLNSPYHYYWSQLLFVVVSFVVVFYREKKKKQECARGVCVLTTHSYSARIVW